VTRGSKECKKERDVKHLEAFAMLGALAWQATTVIKMNLVSLGEIARGLFFLAPGSPPCPGVRPLEYCPSQPIRLAGTTFYRRESIMELPTHRASKVQLQIYS